jgi:hypothetical protein
MIGHTQAKWPSERGPGYARNLRFVIAFCLLNSSPAWPCVTVATTNDVTYRNLPRSSICKIDFL